MKRSWKARMSKKDMLSSFDVLPVQDVEEQGSQTWLRRGFVFTHQFYDEKADKWRFWYGDHPIYADISETSIARDAIARGGAMINDLYKVKMQITQHLTKGGIVRPDIKILQVIDFREAPRQGALPFAR
jgi:hypothetical protein